MVRDSPRELPKPYYMGHSVIQRKHRKHDSGQSKDLPEELSRETDVLHWYFREDGVKTHSLCKGLGLWLGVETAQQRAFSKTLNFASDWEGSRCLLGSKLENHIHLARIQRTKVPVFTFQHKSKNGRPEGFYTNMLKKQMSQLTSR